MKREIIFDLETTGFNPIEGDRIIEIGAVEMINLVPSGKEFHAFVNPMRPIPKDSTAIHGITDEMVKDELSFPYIAKSFINFIGDAKLIAHNVGFDKSFINFELKNAGFEEISDERFVDSLQLAKKQFPGQQNSLDALCNRFNIDLSIRQERHGALLDSILLADVWVELHGGKQISIALQNYNNKEQKNNTTTKHSDKKHHKARECFELSAEELTQHENFIKSKIPNSLWQY